jgi:hypothetical protein
VRHSSDEARLNPRGGRLPSEDAADSGTQSSTSLG